jgi:5-methylcytosine-specific restriction endonuclease McrA
MGKQTTINKQANIKLKKLFEDKHHTCEMCLAGCMGDFGLSFAHRHKRRYYKKCPEMLSDYSQVVLACASCHDKTEYNRELNDAVFQYLRGDDTLEIEKTQISLG